MAVDPAAHRLQVVIEVHAAQVTESHHLVEFGKRLFTSGVGRQIVTGRESVAGIDAHPYPALILHLIDNRTQVVE